jgi:ClpP class serine protease
MLQELASTEYTDYERQVVDFVRKNGGDLNAIVQQYQQKAIEDYLAQNPNAVSQKSYSIDDYSDDELYIADLAVKFPDFTEEELNEKLNSAKTNEELFKKEVDSLRAFYKAEEDKQAEETKLQEKQQYEALQQTLMDSLGKFNEVLLDADDPQSDALEIEESDKQAMLDYLLTPDKDGQSQFDKDLSDPAALIELAWLRTHGRDTLTGISQY